MKKKNKIVCMYEREIKRIDTHTTKQDNKTKKQELNKHDKQSHHAKNFLVCFSVGNSEIKRALVNAIDKKNALRIALNRLCRAFPDIDISRARIGGIYDNNKKKITINR